MQIYASKLKEISDSIDVEKYVEEKAQSYVDSICGLCMPYALAGLTTAKFEIQLPNDIQADAIASKAIEILSSLGYTSSISAEFDSTRKVNYFNIENSWG